MTHARPCRASTITRYLRWERAHLEWERSWEGRALMGEQAERGMVNRAANVRRAKRKKGKA